MTSKQVKSTQPKAGKGPIRYDPETCTYSVPDPEQRRLQCKYPYDDIQAARQVIKANPGRALEFDLECWLFGPKPEQKARTLAELAQKIRLCPTFVREALTGEIDAELAGSDLVKFYPMYYDLGGTGFEPTHNAAVDLVNLLESCGGEKRLPRLQEIDVKILKHLNTSEFAKKLSDLEVELDVPRQTISKRLEILRKLGLTHLTQDKKGAEAISIKGRDFLKTL